MKTIFGEHDMVEIYNVGVYNVGVYNVGTRHVGIDNVGTRHVGIYNVGTRHVGIYNVGTRHVGIYNVGTRHVGVYNVGTRHGVSLRVTNSFCRVMPWHDPTVNQFGSSADERFNPKTSNIDLLIEIDSSDPIDRGEKLLSQLDLFEIFFNHKVDILTDSSIRNPYLKSSIESTKVVIYDN